MSSLELVLHIMIATTRINLKNEEYTVQYTQGTSYINKERTTALLADDNVDC